MNSHGSLLLCRHRCFYHLIIDTINIRFIQYLSFFFQRLRFPKIIYFIFYALVVYEPAERKLPYSLHVENTKHEKKISFFFTWLFLYHKEVTRVFSSASNFAQQFSHKWNWRRALLPQTQICKFGKTKFDTHCLIVQRGPVFFVYTSSSVAFFQKQTTKIWHLREQNFLFVHFNNIRDSNISRECAKILEIAAERGVYFSGRFWKIQKGRESYGKSLPWG